MILFEIVLAVSCRFVWMDEEMRGWGVKKNDNHKQKGANNTCQLLCTESKKL